jgi:hypothetical protein
LLLTRAFFPFPILEKKERGEHDLRQIKEMFIDSKVQVEGDAIKKTTSD